MITIEHTHEGGTLVHGTARGDGSAEILKAAGLRWSRSLGAWYVPQSRDRNAKTWIINRAAEELRSAGHEVAVSIDESQRRDVATIEADRSERAGARAERYSDRAERRGAQAGADYARARQMAEAIPFGQPVFTDHYSAGRDRRYRDRMGRTYDRAFAGMAEAERLQDRARATEATQAHRESIPATLRRIERLEADERAVKRDLTGRMEWVPDGQGGHDYRLVKPEGEYLARLQARAADLADQLTYWREHVAQAKAAGVKVWGPADFTKGDYVQTGRRWYQVERVNPKSLSVPHGTNDHLLAVVTRGEVCHAMGPSQWTRKITYNDVTGRKSAAEMSAMLAEADRQESEQASA